MRDPPGDLLVLEPYGERGAHPVLFCRGKGPSPDGGAHVVSCDREVMPWLDDDDGYAGAIVRVWAGKETQRPGRCGRRDSSSGKPRDRVAARLLHTNNVGRDSGDRNAAFCRQFRSGRCWFQTSDLWRVKSGRCFRLRSSLTENLHEQRDFAAHATALARRRSPPLVSNQCQTKVLGAAISGRIEAVG